MTTNKIFTTLVSTIIIANSIFTYVYAGNNGQFSKLKIERPLYNTTIDNSAFNKEVALTVRWTDVKVRSYAITFNNPAGSYSLPDKSVAGKGRQRSLNITGRQLQECIKSLKMNVDDTNSFTLKVKSTAKNGTTQTASAKITVLPKYSFDDRIDYADPTIFVDHGKYYMSGTANPDDFPILESTDLKTWGKPGDKPDNMILKKGDSTFGTNCFWAPQILKDNGTYYLTYSAEGRMAIASSNSVTGPYRQSTIGTIDDTKEMNIDTYLFKDDDGKYYLYHARFKQQPEGKGNTIYVTEFDMNTRRAVDGTLKFCLSATEPWENTNNNKQFNNLTTEGPTVIKRDGIYYLFYSANDYQSIDYAVGYATATSPYGPWTKHPGNPIIHRSIVGENGSGHGDFFMGLDGKPYYVYHVHSSNSGIHPRKVRIVPLIMKKNANTGIYDITIDKDKIIYPRLKKLN